MPRPFRFGVLAASHESRRGLVESAGRAEDLGFSIYLASDHIAGSKPAPMPALAVVAEATSLRVGTLVLGNDFRHPALVAKEAATLDLFSDGRFELGIGTGWLDDDYAAVGMDLGSAKTRVDRLVEALDVIEGFWAGGRFRLEGEHYRVDLTGRPLPVQRPRPPLLIAGSGPRMLRLAADRADVVSITATLGEESRAGYRASMLRAGAQLDDQVRWIAESGRDPEINVLVHQLSVTPDGDTEVAALAAEAGAHPEGVLESPHVLVGTVDSIVDALMQRRERFGVSYVVVADEQAEEFAPVVARLSGR